MPILKTYPPGPGGWQFGLGAGGPTNIGGEGIIGPGGNNEDGDMSDVPGNPILRTWTPVGVPVTRMGSIVQIPHFGGKLVNNPVPWFCKEMPGSGTYSLDPGNAQGTRIFQVFWQDQYKFISSLLGTAHLDPPGSGTNGTVNVTRPDVFSQGLPFLFCYSVEVKGMEGTVRGYANDPPMPGVVADEGIAQRICYERAIVTAKYKPYDNDLRVKIAGQVISIPATPPSQGGPSTSYSFTGDNFTDLVTPASIGVNQPFPKMYPGGELCIERWLVPPEAHPVLAGLIGCVNSKKFAGKPATTLLLTAIDSKVRYMPDGSPLMHLEFKFNYDPNSWLTLPNMSASPPRKQFILSNFVNPNTGNAPPLVGPDNVPFGVGLNIFGSIIQENGYRYPMADMNTIYQFF